MPLNLPTLVQRIVMDARGANAAKGAIEGTASTLSQSFRTTGLNLSKFVTLPLIGAGFASSKFAGDFENTMSEIVGLAGQSREQVGVWREELLKLGGETARPPQELAEALYFITSSGVDASKAMGVLTAAAKASTAGLGDTVTVANLATSAMNAYAKSGLSAEKATAILVAAVRAGKAEPAEMADSLGRVLGIAAQAGVSFDEVSAAVAAFTLTGQDAAEGTTALSNIFTTMLNPTQQARELLQQFDLSADDLRATLKEKGLLALMRQLKPVLDSTGDAAGQVFGNVRALRGVLGLTGENARKVEQIFADLADTTVAELDAAFGAKTQDQMFKTRAAMANLQAAAIKIGTVMAPAVNVGSAAIGGLAAAFTALPSPVTTAIVSVLGIAAIVGPTLLVTSKVVTALSTMKKNFLALGVVKAVMERGVVGGLQSLGGSLRSFVLGALNPWVLAITVATGALTFWMQRKQEAKRMTEALTQALRDQTDAGKQNARQILLQELSQRGLLRTAEKAGIGIERLLEAVTDRTKRLTATERERLEQADDAVLAWNAVEKELPHLADVYRDATAEAKRLADADRVLAKESGDVEGAMKGVVGVVESAGVATADAGSATDQMATDMAKLESETQRVNDALDDMKIRMAAALGIDLDWQDAMINTRNKLDSLREQIKENGTSLSFNTKKGRENRSALIDLVRSIEDETVAWARASNKTQDAAAMQGFFIKRLREAKRTVPGLATEIDKLMRKAASITPVVKVKVRAPQIAYTTTEDPRTGVAKRVSPSLANMRVFHTGGIVPGTPNDEQLALLRGTERVYTRQQDKRRNEGVGGSARVYGTLTLTADGLAVIDGEIRSASNDNARHRDRVERMRR